MSSESFVKDMFAAFLNTLFKVIAFGLGIILLFIALGAFFSGSDSSTVTNPKVLPNANWKTRPFSHDRPTILRLGIEGSIGLDKKLTADEIKLQLMEAIDGHFKQGQLRAILVVINSPGGVADQADSIYRMLKTFKERHNLPIYAYAHGLCASGGVYIACGADKVFATPDTIVGHVGVLFSPPFFNLSGLMTKLGIGARTLSAGKDKDSMNPFRPWSENEGQQFQYLVDFMYNRFLDVVSTNRPKLTRDDLIEQGARLWPAPDAMRLGYIDGMMNSIDEMLEQFAKELGIWENYQFVELEHHEFLGGVFGASAEALSLFSPKTVEHHIRLPGDLPEQFCGKLLYLYKP